MCSWVTCWPGYSVILGWNAWAILGWERTSISQNDAHPWQLCQWVSSLSLWLFSVFIQRGGDCFLSRCFWCFSFLTRASECEFTLKGKESWILIFNHLWKCWMYQAIKDVQIQPCPLRSSGINVILTGECWGLLFLSRTAMLICTHCSISERDGEGMGWMLVLHCYGLPATPGKE